MTAATIQDMRDAAHAFLASPTPENEDLVRKTSREAGGMSETAIDQRVASLRAQAKGKSATEPCERCGGSGQYLHYGVCFDCGGSGEAR